MKAIVYREYGSADVLRLEEIAKQTPNDAEVLIRVRATEVTKSDCELRSFRFPVKWFWLPLRLALGITRPRRQVLGCYFSGDVEAVGKDVSTLAVGDQVFGSTGLRMGAYGEYMCLPAEYTISPKPSNMSFEEAAAVGDVPAAVEFGRVAAAPVNTLRAGDKISSRFQDGRMV